jgi:competence protein ComEC
VAFSVGVIAAQLLSPLLPLLVLAGLLAGAAVVIRPRLVLIAALSLIAFLVGVGRGALAAPPQLPALIDGQDVLITGQVDDDPVERKTNRRLTVRVAQIAGVSQTAAGNLRLEATVYGMTPVKYGDLVLLGGVIEQPAVFEQFDYRAYLAEQGIAAVMPSARVVRVTTHPGDPFHTLLFAVRHGLIATVDGALPEPQAALVLGVVFGYRAALPTLLQQQMIASGLIPTVLVHMDVRSHHRLAEEWTSRRLDNATVYWYITYNTDATDPGC